MTDQMPDEALGMTQEEFEAVRSAPLAVALLVTATAQRAAVATYLPAPGKERRGLWRQLGDRIEAWIDRERRSRS